VVYGRENSGAGRASDSTLGTERVISNAATTNSAVGGSGATNATVFAAEHPSMQEQLWWLWPDAGDEASALADVIEPA
jgi:hypothetical protein